MRIVSDIPALSRGDVRRILSGLPPAKGYLVHAKPLRYRRTPHLAAMTDFSAKTITVQLPEPFYPFGEAVPYGARRRPGDRMQFIWLSEGVTFRTPRQVLRFLYCHEWMHVFGISGEGGRRVGETACDRFALLNYMRPKVTVEDARRSLDWREGRRALGRTAAGR
ncbi:MAG: hypothetical protein M3O98_03040 [Actinomycetota bacterium]|nr:hypothetical protein [Actinomycetota bacterium]